MSKYKCERCDKIFSQKSTYNNHKNRKNLCKIIIPDSFDNNETSYIKMSTIIKELFIVYEENNVLKNQVEKSKNQIEILKNQVEKIEKQVDVLNKKTNNTISGNKNIQINGNNNTTINELIVNKPNISILINFDNEMKYNLNNKRKEKILKLGFSSIIGLLNLTHFNGKYNKYKNAYINKMSDRKWCKIYKNGKWEMELTDVVIDTLIENSRKYISDIFDEVDDKDKDEDRYIGIHKLLRRFNGETIYVGNARWKEILDEIKGNIVKGLCNNKYIINSK